MPTLNEIADPKHQRIVAALARTLPAPDHPDCPLSRLEAEYTRLMEGEGTARTEQGQADFLAAQDRLVGAILDTPAETTLGLVIKLRVTIRYAGLPASPDNLVVCGFLAVLEDAERLVRRGSS